MTSTLSPSARGRAVAAAPTRRPSAEVVVGLALAAGLAAAAFFAGGGTSLGPNTWTEIALTAVGVALAIVACSTPGPSRAWGSAALLLFVALTGFTAASIAWSVQPANSWVEANRTVSYLATFGGALALARIAPRRWPAVLGALAALASVVSAYSLLAKVFPAALDAGDPVGRVRLPFDYWNAVGLMAAMGVPACMWAASRREAGPLSRAAAAPALGILVVAILLSLSRGALIVTAIGLACWFALVPVRLRAAMIAILGAVGGGAVSAWALSDGSLIHDNVREHARVVAGHELGLALLAMVVALSAAGAAAVHLSDRLALAAATRRRAGAVLVGLAALIPLGGIGAAAASHRGLPGTISDAWAQLTSPHSGGAAPVPGRLLQLGSSRGRYWNEALRVGEHALLKGSGADGFATAGTHYTVVPTTQNVQHAHSYLLETFADLGLIGVGLSLALLIAWAVAARRAVRGLARPADPRLTQERNGLLTLLVVVVVYGLNSAVDWSWFIPGPTLAALVCAGWLAGRGPLTEPARGWHRPRVTPGVIGAATVAAAVTLVGAWMMLAPLRSADADAAALGAAGTGNLRAALADARAAVTENPVSADALIELGALDQAAGDARDALAEYRKAVGLQPENPQTWFELGEYLLVHRRPAAALPALERALSLYRGWPAAAGAIARANAELRDES